MALVRIAPEQSSNAVAVLKSLQYDPEIATVDFVGKYGTPEGKPHKDFQNPSSRFYRAASSVALWRLKLEPTAPVAALIELLGERGKDPDSGIAWFLGEIGPDAKAALPALEKFVGPNTFTPTRRKIAIAIRKIDPDEADRMGLPGLLAIP
jgi:hypothetical protein